MTGNDPILDRMIEAARADPETLGLILDGSRGAGCGDAESDYDLSWVLTDAAYHSRQERGESAREVVRHPGEPKLDLCYTCPEKLSRNAREHGWWTPGQAMARVVLDKTGEVTVAHAAIARMPEEKARVDIPAWFDAYLNGFYRSMKAWRRGNELGGRLECAESLMHLTRLLFTLERRWPPYHDRLYVMWADLAVQEWPPGYLREVFLDLMRSGDPTVQQELEDRVELLLRSRGYAHVVAAWEGEIERVKAFRFERKGHDDGE
jgi:hypothetical protein